MVPALELYSTGDQLVLCLQQQAQGSPALCVSLLWQQLLRLYALAHQHHIGSSALASLKDLLTVQGG